MEDNGGMEGVPFGVPDNEEEPLPAATSSAAPAEPPLLRGPPTSACEVAVGISAPPLPPQALALAIPQEPPPNAEENNDRAANKVEAMLAKLPTVKLPFKAPKVPERMQRLEPKRQCLAFVRRLPSAYCEQAAKFPWAFLLLYAWVVVIIISAGWRPLEINTDIEAFREVVGEAALRQRAYTSAIKSQKAMRNDTNLAHRKTFELQLFYEAKSGSVLSEAALRDIRSLETLLRNLPGWKKMCGMSDESARFRCEPGESLGNYAWPDREEMQTGAHTPFTLKFNGGSRERLPVHAFLTYLHEGRAAPHDLRKFLPHEFGGPREDATLLRTLFTFTAPSLIDAGFTEAYEEFVSKELFPALLNATEQAERTPDDPWIEPWSVRLYFRGHEIEAHEVRYYLAGDLEWAIGALFITFAITYLQLRSLFLAVVGLSQVCLVPLIAYVIVGLHSLSLASFLCIFLVIGLASNDLLAVKEYWVRVGRDCALHYPTSTNSFGFKEELTRYYSIRLSRTFQAILFRFLPQTMTMCSWLVLLLSLIRPIREFGMFMFACTAIACVLCVGIFPPLLVMHEVHVKPSVHAKLHRIPANILEPSSLRFPWRPIVRKCLMLANPRMAKFIWIGATAAMCIIILITGIVAANSDNPGLPEVYSPSHHASAGRPLVDAFIPTSPALAPASQTAVVCQLSAVGTAACGLHWCEAPQAGSAAANAAAAQTNVSKCTCQRNASDGMFIADYVNQTVTVSGDAFSLANSATRRLAISNYMATAWSSHQETTFIGGKDKLLSSLVLEHWESGLTNVEPVIKMPNALVKLNKTAPAATMANTAQVEVACFCGSRVCSAPKGHFTDSNSLEVPAPAPSPGRLLAEVQKPAPAAVEVVIVFGIAATGGTSLLKGDETWSLDSSFEPDSPWAQRAMLSMCNDVPASLNVVESHCWIKHFRTWMIGQGRKFPVQRFDDFQTSLDSFFHEMNTVHVTAMWTDSDEKMRGTAFAFKVPPKSKAAVKDILKDRAAWIDYVVKQNSAARSVANSAWATSTAWAEAEAQHEAQSNAWNVAFIAIAICVLACVAYTWDLVFTALVVVVAMYMMVFLSFFMFCLCQWAPGPWEVILLVAYLMFSLEPVLRIGRGTVWGGWLVKEAQLSGNIVTPVNSSNLLALPAPGNTPSAALSAPLALPPPGHTPSAAQSLALMDGEAAADNGEDRFEQDDDLRNPDAPDAEGSSNNSPVDNREEAAARSAFEGRMHLFVLNVSNATFGSSVKLILCGMLALACEFRLFVRLGAVSIVAPLLYLPCIFILVPTALVLIPIREKPDLVTIYEFLLAKWNARDEY